MNAKRDVKRRGRAILRAHMTADQARPGPARALFDVTTRAGRATDLALRIRRHGQLSYQEVVNFAALTGMPESDVRLWALQELEELDAIEVARDEHGHPTVIEERVGVVAPVLQHCAELWDRLAPLPIEACAVEAADMIAFTPMARSDLRGALEAAGFPAALHRRAIDALRGVGLLQAVRSQMLGEDVCFAPYVWGTEAVDTAEYLHKLPANERDALMRLARAAAERPGRPENRLGADDKLLRAARHAGLVERVPVSTTGSRTDRGFVFSPQLENGVANHLTDATHERKLFVAHILNGHYFAPPRYGRIHDPLVLVDALLRNGKVGPATSIGREYILLEAAGIVRTDPSEQDDRRYLHLVKPEVARDARDLLEQALGSERSDRANSLEALWLPGTTYFSPERDRSRLSPPEGEEGEIIASTVMELRAQIERRMRGEEL